MFNVGGFIPPETADRQHVRTSDYNMSEAKRHPRFRFFRETTFPDAISFQTSRENVINHRHTVPFAMFRYFHVSELFVPNRSSRIHFASLRQATQTHSKSTIDN